MNSDEQKRFDALYVQHLRALKLHGYSAATIDGYSRAVRRLVDFPVFGHRTDAFGAGKTESLNVSTKWVDDSAH